MKGQNGPDARLLGKLQRAVDRILHQAQAYALPLDFGGNLTLGMTAGRSTGSRRTGFWMGELAVEAM